MTSEAPKSRYISIQEACDLLRISRPTFNKIRKRKNILEFSHGHRPRFLRAEIEGLAGFAEENEGIEKMDLTVFSPNPISNIQLADGVFDLRRIRVFDPFGALNLFCSILQQAKSGKKVRLELKDNFMCNHLRSIGFFAALSEAEPENILWDASMLKTNVDDYLYPVGLTKISMRKQEVPVVEKIIALLRAQGFSEAIGGYIGWVLGELVDNAMTHLVHNGFVSDCYLLAQRYRFANSRSECLIIAVADTGPGIHATLQKNPKYADLTDARAFLTAFKPKVSSWPDEYGRGKGLTDILGIAMGNRSVLRVESGLFGLQADFREQKFSFGPSSAAIDGTRFALVLIDHEFEVKSKLDVSQFIDRRVASL